MLYALQMFRELPDLLTDDHGHVVVVVGDDQVDAIDAYVSGGELRIKVDPSSDGKLTTKSLKEKMGDHPFSSVVVEWEWERIEVENVSVVHGDLQVQVESPDFMPEFHACRRDREYRRRWPGLPEDGPEDRLIRMMTDAIRMAETTSGDVEMGYYDFIRGLPGVLEGVVDAMYRQRKLHVEGAPPPPAVEQLPLLGRHMMDSQPDRSPIQELTAPSPPRPCRVAAEERQQLGAWWQQVAFFRSAGTI